MPLPRTTHRSPGRPRPQTTIDRDEEIYRLLAGKPSTRNQLADTLSLAPSIVYLSLDRLRRAGRIRQCIQNGTITWTAQDGTPCP